MRNEIASGLRTTQAVVRTGIDRSPITLGLRRSTRILPVGMSDAEYLRALHFWDRSYPGIGERLLHELSWIYAANLHFSLSPSSLAASTLDAQLERDDVYWENIKGTRFISRQQYTMLCRPIQRRTRDASCGVCRLAAPRFLTLYESLYCRFQRPLEDRLGVTGFNRVMWCIEREFGDRLRRIFQCSLDYKLRPEQILGMQLTFTAALAYAIGLELSSDEDDGPRLWPLLQYWRSGFPPVGFDKKPNLLRLSG